MPAFLLVALRHWKLAALGLMALLLAVQTVRLGHAHNKIERREIDIRELRGELERISTERNEQAKKTGQSIGQAERGEREARPIADRIREAPIPPNCSTPGIEILRNEI
jgi:hypothetical protein